MTPRRMLSVLVLLCTFAGRAVFSHCQIPCGIYDDETRFTLLAEHITTIEKSMKQITELSADPKANANQLIRWVNNKDSHADQLTEIVTSYFLAQRVKAPASDAGKEARDKYLQQLELLHGMIVAAMKSKQTTDLANTEALRQLLHDFQVLYTGKHEHQH